VSPRLHRVAGALLLALAASGAQAATMVVEVDAPAASDDNPGTAARPLKTVGEAMKRLRPGDEVVIGDGIYRETVLVPRLAAGRTATVIRARHPGKAVVRGSDIVTGWMPVAGGRLAVDWKDKAGPSQVFVAGRLLKQRGGTVFGGFPEAPGHEFAAAHRNEGGIWPGRLAGGAADLKPGEFFYDRASQRLLIYPEASIENMTVEVSVRPYVFKADSADRMRVSGLVFEHSNTSSVARHPGVVAAGNDNVFEQLQVRYMDATGIYIVGERSELLDSTIEDNGQLGLNARGRKLTIAGNRILRNNYRGFNKWWEAGGIKIISDIGLHESTIRDNVVAFNRGDGIWVDWMNTQIRITHNVTAFNAGFGIHYEASQSGFIDDNASYGNTMRGIYVFESSDTRVENNVVLANAMEGIAVVDGERSAQFPQLKPRNNSVVANTVGWSGGQAELVLPGAGIAAQSDRNVFIAEQAPRLVQGWAGLGNAAARGLSDWRGRSRLDAASRERRAPQPPALAQLLREQRLVTVEQLRATVAVLAAE